jgi:hypothetical protein
MTEQPRDPETGQFVSEDEVEEPAATEEELENGDQEGEPEADEATGDDAAEEADQETEPAADEAEEAEE